MKKNNGRNYGVNIDFTGLRNGKLGLLTGAGENIAPHTIIVAWSVKVLRRFSDQLWGLAVEMLCPGQ